MSGWSSKVMESYTRFTDNGTSPDEPGFYPPFTSEYDLHPSGFWGKLRRWWRKNVVGEPATPEPPSGYMTLIPLNDARLKPQNKVLLYTMMALLVFGGIAATFFLVPRGFSAGEIDIHSDRMSWNTTKATYQLNLLARIPINNPNYLQARVHGQITVYFYDTAAGQQNISSTVIKARAHPQVIEAVVDASNVPGEYALTILSECAAFPRRLVFFLKGNLVVEDFWQRVELSPIDTYFMIDCVNGGRVPKAPDLLEPPAWIPSSGGSTWPWRLRGA